MNIQKYFWAVRAILYNFKFKKVGKFSYIGKPLIVDGTKNIEIGARARIYPGMRIETYGKLGKITIEDNVSIGQHLHIVSYDSDLVIGSNSTISSNVLITNMDHDYKQIDVHIMQQDVIRKETKIGQNCFIGYGSIIQAGTKLGNQCIVGANSVVRGDYPDYCVIAGAPARVVKKYNKETKEWDTIKY